MEAMGEERRSITADLRLLLEQLPDVARLAREDPRVQAWEEWKHALLAQVRNLERREVELQSEPYLWIHTAQVDLALVPENRTE